MIHTYQPGISYLGDRDPSLSMVLVGGCFDVLHYGHLKFLQEARSLGDQLIIALEPDDTIVTTKDRRVFHTQGQRAELLDALDVVSDVLTLPLFTSDDDYMDLVLALRPQIIALTEGDPHLAHKTKQAHRIGGRTIEIPYIKGFSTTDLLHKYCAF